MGDKLLTTEEVAKYFGVSSSTVTQKFIKEGLKYFPVGPKDFRYNSKDVLEFEELKKNEVNGRNEIYFNQKIITAKFPVRKKDLSKKLDRVY